MPLARLKAPSCVTATLAPNSTRPGCPDALSSRGRASKLDEMQRAWQRRGRWARDAAVAACRQCQTNLVWAFKKIGKIRGRRVSPSCQRNGMDWSWQRGEVGEATPHVKLYEQAFPSLPVVGGARTS
ncbi:hypothetical protein GQ600_20889 [Phytophthora cactorum]|nr:hypothetical protein GQ600_20889 [Phytophthora cactorum]